MRHLTRNPILSLLTTMLLALALGLFGCPAGDDDDSSDDDDTTGDDDDATGDDDDATGDDDDATGDDDDATGDDDDSGDDDDDSASGPLGACRFLVASTLAACQPSIEVDCEDDGAPQGVSVEWIEESCPGGAAASCLTEESEDWFYYLDQTSDMLEPWCGVCDSGLTPSDYCDSVGDDDDSAGDDDDSATTIGR